MKHGVSLKHVDNSAIQKAIEDKAHPDTIAKLKANVAFNCVYGFEYHEVSFEDLANLLSADVGFSNFKFKDVESATYDKEKHPDAFGLIRGMYNIIGGCSWICFDVDVTTLTDKEMHRILHKVNHHIARTSDKNNPHKMRVIVELSEMITVSREVWKHFISILAESLGIGKIDKLPMSQVLYGYEGREVLSVVDQKPIVPSTYLKMAQMRHNTLEEKKALEYSSPEECAAALATPYTTFSFAYNAAVGDRWRTGHAAIHKAKELGASREYIVDLLYSINDFLDNPKPRSVVEATQISAI